MLKDWLMVGGTRGHDAMVERVYLEDIKVERSLLSEEEGREGRREGVAWPLRLGVGRQISMVM